MFKSYHFIQGLDCNCKVFQIKLSAQLITLDNITRTALMIFKYLNRSYDKLLITT